MWPLEFARFWRSTSAVLLLLVLVATLIPVDWLFDDSDSTFTLFEHADKLAHALTFLLLALWFAGQYRSLFRIGMHLLAFGVVIELCQWVTGYRSADWVDMAANTAGIIMGIGIATTGFGGWCQRAENWYLTRNA